MTQWVAGDILGPTNLNSRGASATTTAGFSSNTLGPESGSTVSMGGVTVLKSIDSGGAFLNVLAFGAVGDGSTDDAASIRSAVAAIPAVGGCVYLPAKTFLVGSTITLPADRLVRLQGAGAYWIGKGSSSVGTYGGTVLLRSSAFSNAPLISQAQAGSASTFGCSLRDLGLHGSNVSGDLLYLAHTNSVDVSGCWFASGKSNGLYAHGPVNNSKIINSRFYELGSGGSSYGVCLISDDSGAPNNLEFVACEWETGQGAYFFTDDQSTGKTAPVDQVKILGGKMEFSGNLELTIPAVPLVQLNQTTRFTVNGTQFVNGLANGATHIQINNSTNLVLAGIACMSQFTSDGSSPQYFVDIQGGDHIMVSGTFYQGAGNGGAQVHVSNAATNVSLDPTNQYNAPVGTGVPVKWGNTPGSQERAGAGWTGLQSTTAQSLGAGTTLDGPSRGNSIERVSAGGSNVVISTGNKGDVFAIVHQGTAAPLFFNPADATSHVYQGQNASVLPSEAALLIWDSSSTRWVKVQSRQWSYQTVAYAATITPDPTLGQVVEVASLTSNTTIAAPSGTRQTHGMTCWFRFLQDGTGGRAVSWNTVWKQGWSDAGNTANKQSMIGFYFDGTNWVQLTAQTPYY